MEQIFSDLAGYQNVMPSTWKQIGKDWDNSFRNLMSMLMCRLK